MRTIEEPKIWHWLDHRIGWSLMGDADAEEAVVLIHGRYNTNHWRFNQPVTEMLPTYAIDSGFGAAISLGSLEG